MQVILTEEEYNNLKALADNSKVVSKLYTQLVLKHSDLTTKYYQLLNFGVIPNPKDIDEHR